MRKVVAFKNRSNQFGVPPEDFVEELIVLRLLLAGAVSQGWRDAHEDLVLGDRTQGQEVVVGRHEVLGVLYLSVARIDVVQRLKVRDLLPIQPRN